MLTFSYLNHLDDATPITASSEENSLPAINTINQFRSKSFRTQNGDIVDQWIEYDMGYQVNNPTTLVITNEQRGIQLSSLAVIKLQLSNDANWTTPSVNETIPWNDTIIFKYNASGWGNYRFMRLLISDINNVDNFLELGNVFFGTSFIPTSSDLNNGWVEALVDDSESFASDGNELWFDTKTQRSRYELQLNLLSRADKDSYREMFQLIGNHKAFYISLDPEAIISDSPEEKTKYCRLITEFRTPNVFFDNYNIPVVVEELV